VTSAQIKARAIELGFDLCGVSPAGEVPGLAILPAWLAAGRAGRMTYLNRTARKRADVRRWMPSARSVIVVACHYHANRPLSTEVTDPSVAIISRYAWGDDYHRVMTARLGQLLEWMKGASGEAFDAKVSVDTGPVQERVYAARAGIGWVGKNTCVIHAEWGSWILLGVLITSLALEPDEPVLEQCGTCTLCMEACPTHAIVEPYVLDARRCLSYLTIEIKKSIPAEQRADLGTHVFGCDRCQDVCPFNQAGGHTAAAEWQPREGLDQPRLRDLWALPDAALESLAAGTPLLRRGVAGLRRNLAVALGNSADPASVEALAHPPSDADAPSLRDPIVAEHLAWARGRRASG
jgi:epoxyqueuosine reductase